MTHRMLVGAGMFAMSLPALGVDLKEDPRFEVGGRIFVDAALYEEDVTPMGSGTEFRAARLRMSGDMNEDIDYKIQVDFEDDDLTLKDAWIRFGLGSGALTLGQFKQPFSVEEQTSRRYITFMERGLPAVFVTSRRIGVGYVNQFTDRLLFMGSVYGQEAGDTTIGDEGVGVGARLVYNPILDLENNRVIHLGAAVAQEEPSSTDTGVVIYATRPESHVTVRRLVNTGFISDVENISKIGLEFAGVWGPFSVQSEYIQNETNTGPEDLSFSGAYAYASWFPTGQSRAYQGGNFDRVKLSDGKSAWELALRYSTVDLNDGMVFGGVEDNITFGVNYYLKPKIRFMFNYIKVDVDQTDPVTGIVTTESPNIYQVRAQVDF